MAGITLTQSIHSNDLGYFTNNNFLDHGCLDWLRLDETPAWYNRIGPEF